MRLTANTHFSDRHTAVIYIINSTLFEGAYDLINFYHGHIAGSVSGIRSKREARTQARDIIASQWYGNESDVIMVFRKHNTQPRRAQHTHKHPLTTGHKAHKPTVSIKLITEADTHGPCVPMFMTGKVIRRVSYYRYMSALVALAEALWTPCGHAFRVKHQSHYLFPVSLVNTVTGDVLAVS